MSPVADLGGARPNFFSFSRIFRRKLCHIMPSPLHFEVGTRLWEILDPPLVAVLRSFGLVCIAGLILFFDFWLRR